MSLPQQLTPSVIRKVSSEWTPAELGAFMRLAWYHQKHGFIPDTKQALGRVIGCAYTNVHRYEQVLAVCVSHIVLRYIVVRYITGRYITFDPLTNEPAISCLGNPSNFRHENGAKSSEKCLAPARVITSISNSKKKREKEEGHSDGNSDAIAPHSDQHDHSSELAVPQPAAAHVPAIVQELVAMYPEGYLVMARNNRVPQEEIPVQLRLWAERNKATMFSDTRHMLNSWGRWCMRFSEKKSEPAPAIMPSEPYRAPQPVSSNE